MRTLGATLTFLRVEKGLGQKQLAAYLNLSISAISSYENDIHAPDLGMVCKLADFFNVTTDYLLGHTEYRCPPEIFRQYVTRDYTLQDMLNTVLSLDTEGQVSVVNFVKYMKHLHEES